MSGTTTDLNELLVFVRVVQAGGFTAAARALGMPKSTVSRKVSELEERLRARLLQRTTRKLNLTEVGRTYYEHCARIAGEVDEAERAVTNLQSSPRGLLRVTAGVNATYLGPIVSDYLKLYPDVQLELLCTGRVVDLVEERFDIGIRAGTLSDSTLVARKFGRLRWFFVATPGYLKKRGRPRSPEDLKEHDCLFFGTSAMTVQLRLEKNDTHAQVAVPARLLVSDMDVVAAAARGGLGIALLPAYTSVEALQSGIFERVLRDWEAPATPFNAVYPSTRYLSPKVKTFIDYLQQRMTPPPWELGPAL